MPINKLTDSRIIRDITDSLGGKVISKIEAYHHGSVDVIEILFTDSTKLFVKFYQYHCETGGDNGWGSGTSQW